MHARSEPRTQLVASAAVVALGLAALARPRAAAAQDDGIYGRFRADTVLSLEAGGGALLGPAGIAPAAYATARVRALDTAGVFVGYHYAFGAARDDAASAGLDLRPLMLARIFQNWEQGPRALDLALDSIGLELGVAWLRPGAPWGAGSGFAFVLGTGVDVPLVWSEGRGLLARLGVRWVHAAAWDAQGPGASAAAGAGPGGVGANALLVTVSLVGRGMARLGLLGVR